MPPKVCPNLPGTAWSHSHTSCMPRESSALPVPTHAQGAAEGRRSPPASFPTAHEPSPLSCSSQHIPPGPLTRHIQGPSNPFFNVTPRAAHRIGGNTSPMLHTEGYFLIFKFYFHNNSVFCNNNLTEIITDLNLFLFFSLSFY